TDPWLDEGLNEYASDRVLERVGGVRLPLPSQAMVERFGWLAQGASWDPFGLPAAAYLDRREYEAGVYNQTSTFLSSLERHYGSDRLLAALGRYARRFRFRHPTPADFISAMSDGLGEDIAPLVRQLMAGAFWD